MKKLPLKAQGIHAPIYHWTGNLKGVLESDILKTGDPSVPLKHMPKKCICLTRMNYMSAADCGGNVRFVLNTDLLKLYGYQIFPTDELGYGSSTNQNKEKRTLNLGKVMPTIGRWIHHKTNFKGIKDISEGLEFEYEERIYKEIKNFGKYVLAIQFLKTESYDGFLDYEKNVMLFLKKYDHIKIEHIKKEVLWKSPKEVLIKEKELV